MTTEKTKRKFSPMQMDVMYFGRDGQGSAFIEAVAGAGKTTTLIGLCTKLKGTIAFAAYNKKIAQEITGKLAEIAEDPKVTPEVLERINAVESGTFHSFGFKAWRKVAKNVKVEDDKVSDILKGMGVELGLISFISKLVSLAKNNALTPDADRAEYQNIIDHHDMMEDLENQDDVDYCIDTAIKALVESRRTAYEVIDFDDMIYMPATTQCRMWQYDNVLVDEAQDTNKARRLLARKMLKRGGRAFFVGDRHQAIYGFTGADNDAIDQIVREFNCTMLPLTVTYRCPKAVVNLARTIVSHIEAAPEAPEGEVTTIDEADMLRATDLTAEDAILCRKTAPLVEAAFSFIRRGIACHVEGREIGQQLIKLLDRWKKVKTIDTLRTKLEDYKTKQVKKFLDKGKEQQAEMIADKIDTLLVLLDGCDTLECVRAKITKLFTDEEGNSKKTLTLSTVHKAKGREWNRVFVYGYDVWMPSKYARQQWQLEQESNLIYVAYTRSQNKLVLVRGPKEKPQA